MSVVAAYDLMEWSLVTKHMWPLTTLRSAIKQIKSINMFFFFQFISNQRNL